MEKSQGIAELTKALIKIQPLLKPASKDKTNPFLKSKYADLSGVWESCRDLLGQNGLAIIQVAGSDASGNFLETILAHSSGEWISGRYPLKPIKADDPQALGSALTYARRYTLAAILGIVTDDDDAEGAMGRQSESKQKTESKAEKSQVKTNTSTSRAADSSDAEWEKTRRPEQVPGSNEWILSEVKRLGISEETFLTYLNQTLHIPVDQTIETTLKTARLTDEVRSTIAKKINATAAKAVNNA